MSCILYLSLLELEGNINRKSELRVQIFNQIERSNIFSWNTVIRLFAECVDSQNSVIASDYYMKPTYNNPARPVPNNYTFPYLIQAFRAISDLRLVENDFIVMFSKSCKVTNCLYRIFFLILI